MEEKMKYSNNKNIVALIAGTSLLMWGCGTSAPPASSTAATADKSAASEAPAEAEVSDFVLKDVDGKSHALSDYMGKKVIVVSFWATWCEPCKKEMVKLEELYKAHAEKGLMILSISMDEPESQGEVRPFVKQRGFTFPVLLDTESQVTNQLNPRRSAPYNLIINRQGSIYWSHEGYVPGDEKKLEKAIFQAMGTGE
jgi:cytochrome c biogenesis protein CcmG, thiol:disulfide interchange protein DsbE